MRILMRKSGLLAGVLLLLAGATANAAVGNAIEVKIPFAFIANGTRFPAGQYMIQSEDSATMLIRGESGRHQGAFVMVTPANGRDPAGSVPALTFTRYEKQLRLSTVWEAGTLGAQLVGR